jgi:DNA-binding beta-propeller fold protein YncE
MTSSDNWNVGTGEFRYRTVPGWGQLPAGWRFVDVAGIATDSKNRVYVFNRGEHPIIIFESDGRFVNTWGEKVFLRPHGIFIDSNDLVYCTDDADQTVRKFTLDGRLLMTLGISGQATDTGAVDNDYRTIRRAGLPFNQPTNLAIAPDATLVVSDGYGNARVHRFTPDGRLLHSWGAPGSEPGQFNLPHGIAVDGGGRVYVADRENSRIQVFDASGGFIEEWTDVARPMEVFIDRRGDVFVAEVGWRAGLFPWHVPPPDGTGGRLSIFDLDGRLQARWGGGSNPTAPGDFFAPHDVWVDREGDVYVGEVVMTGGGNRGLVAPECHCLQKFTKLCSNS